MCDIILTVRWIAYITFTELLPYPSLWALIPTVATAIVIASGVNRNPFSFESIFGKGIFQFIGKISYSWYLIHWPIFVVFLLAGNRMDISNQLAIILISFLLSIVSFYVIENPIRHNQSFKSSLKNTYILGISLILIVSSVCGGLIYFKTKSLESITSQPQKQVVVDKTEAEVVQKVKEGLELKTLPSNLVVPLEKVSTDKAGGCIYSEKTITVPIANNEKCYFGDITSDKKIVLLGDSHSNQWVDPLSTISEKYKYKLIQYSKSGCPMTDTKVVDKTLNRDYFECYSWRDEAKPDLIITTSFVYGKDDVEGYDDYLNKISRLTKKVVVLIDNSIPKEDVPQCLSTNPTAINNCNIIEKDTTRWMINKYLSFNKNNIQVLDTTDLFCYKKVCPAIIDNIVVYRDGSHITNSYAKYLGSVLESKLNLGK